MKALSIKKIIEYNSFSTKRRATMVGKLQIESIFSNNNSRDYWHRSLSAIRRAFKTNDYQILTDRIDSISDDYSKTSVRTTKLMYERNNLILRNFLQFDYNKLLPQKKVRFISQNSDVSAINVNNIQLKIHGDDLFTYKIDETEYAGAVWFVASKNGYKNDELAIFVDALYRMLKDNLSDNYDINTDYCLVMDAMKMKIISYSQIKSNNPKSKLDTLVSEIFEKL